MATLGLLSSAETGIGGGFEALRFNSNVAGGNADDREGRKQAVDIDELNALLGQY